MAAVKLKTPPKGKGEKNDEEYESKIVSFNYHQIY